MKVLDLQCAFSHTFEGWFSSEDDFLSQLDRALVQCPVCGDSSVLKRPSAPRLNLSGTRTELAARESARNPESDPFHTGSLWLEMTRHLLANSTDVGHQFADEARKMHYGEAEERSIRGKASVQETRALLEEGIEIVPLALPFAPKESLH